MNDSRGSWTALSPFCRLPVTKCLQSLFSFPPLLYFEVHHRLSGDKRHKTFIYFQRQLNFIAINLNYLRLETSNKLNFAGEHQTKSSILINIEFLECPYLQ